MTSLFNASKLKIKRANHHINDLQLALETFLKSDFYRLSIKKDPNGGNNVLEFKSTREMPWMIPLIIGDAIHNLRAALDLMTCEIVTMANQIPDKYTKFPFRETRQELESAIPGGKIKFAPQTIIDLITDTIKPYKGGNNPLYALNDLDIIDKHKLLIPTISVTSLVGVSIVDSGGNRFYDITLRVGQGGTLHPISTPHNINITNNGQPTFNVFFDKGQVFEGQPVIPTLHQLSQLVSGIVQTIAKAYLTLG